MLLCLMYFFALLLILTGLFFVFYLVFSKLITEDSDGFFVAVTESENPEILHSRIYDAFIQINMMNFGKKRPVYVLGSSISEETKKELLERAVPGCRIIFLKNG